MPQFIDFTQFSTFLECPYLWYEKYVKGLRLVRGGGREDGTRVIGSLVHKGLENYYKTNQLDITQEYIDELNAAPEAVYTARLLLQGYIQNYAGEKLLVSEVHTEEPLQFLLEEPIPVPCLAKLDTYGLLETTTQVYNGGDPVYLEPGYWIVEHKTKAAEFSRSKYAQGWMMNLQVDFQVLALQSHLLKRGIQAPVQGLIINVLEKPRNTRPTRKCRKCGEYSDFSTWVVADDGKHSCPWCGATQKLTPLADAASYEGDYYRIIVQNPIQRRTATLQAITSVWLNMKWMEEIGPNASNTFDLFTHMFNYRSCVHPIYGACEFFEPHSQWTGANEGPLYQVKENPVQYATE